jgi:flagellar hook-basal body complex protein FliE
MTPIASIVPLSQITSAYAGGTAASSAISPAVSSAPGTDFAAMVGNATHSALQTLHQGEQTTAAGVVGKADVQDVVQALSNAEVTMQAVVEVRDKVVAAYNDIMHMSV